MKPDRRVSNKLILDEQSDITVTSDWKRLRAHPQRASRNTRKASEFNLTGEAAASERAQAKKTHTLTHTASEAGLKRETRIRPLLEWPSGVVDTKYSSLRNWNFG